MFHLLDVILRQPHFKEKNRTYQELLAEASSNPSDYLSGKKQTLRPLRLKEVTHTHL
jgi:hypothetical protein